MLFEELGKVEARSHLWADLSSHLKKKVDISISIIAVGGRERELALNLNKDLYLYCVLKTKLES